ncbi:protein HUA2-LIKE 3-like [Tasmannia lanceolata]|uniref:protein HUA2-LIKE 3-like n=1 Tax=Tasmannia lanceolata TaxID=3420 RepID=UPI0040632584
MAPSRKRGGNRASSALQKWKIGDLVLAKVKGFPAWPATVSEPEKWGYSTNWKKVLVYFFGTKQIAFCNPADVETFTEEKKKSLLTKRQRKGADFIRAVDEIISSYEKSKKPNQDDEYNSVDEGTLSNAGSSESSKAKSWTGSPKQSPVSEGSKDKSWTRSPKQSPVSVHYSSIDTSGSCNPADIPATLMGIADLHDMETVPDEPIKDVTILDQHRETSLGTINSLRKRLRDAPLQSCVIRRPPSIRRSRSSSRVDPSKFQKPSVIQEESIIGNTLIRKSPDNSLCDDTHALVYSAAVVSNGSSEDNGSGIVAMESEAVSLNEGSTLESNCKIEYPGVIAECFENGTGLSGRLVLRDKGVLLKKKRKPNRKRVNHGTLTTARFDKEIDSDFPNSTNTCEKSNERFHRADGDEHLPLVKRARARMGKPPTGQCDDFVDTNGKSAEKSLVNHLETVPISFKGDDNFPVEGTSLGVKEFGVSSPPSKNCTQCTGDAPQLWKATKYHVRSSSIDVEAALPPSKRLHRALEAMSANNTCTEFPSAIEVLSNGFTASFDTSSPRNCINNNAGSPIQAQTIDSSDNNTVCNSTSGFSCSTPPTPEILTKTNSGVKLGGEGNFHCAEVSSPVLEEINKEVLQLRKDCSDDVLKGEAVCSQGEDSDGKHETAQRTPQRQVSISRTKDVDSFSPLNDNGVLPTVANGGPIASIIHENLNTLKSQSDENTEVKEMNEVAKEVKGKLIPMVRDISSYSTSMKVLIAAAQAKRHLSRSTSIADNVSDDKIVSDAVSSLSSIHGVESSLQVSSPYPTNFIDGRKFESLLNHGQTALGRWTGREEAKSALKAFEVMLGTLSRTKESIGRATRLAIDCAKYGIAGEVVELLLRSLESESSLHRRVDLFFLVDSIIQSSQGQKGDIGDIYPTAVQAVLSRLLYAAAPPGHAARENRKQCLKVLRLWLERKTLPESIVRKHMRELDSLNDASFTNAFSRREARMERALNDPLREMDGMLVDEYGSNTSFQLPGFLIPCLLEDNEEGCSTDEESFEAVTPEHDPGIPNESGETDAFAAEKQHHILEDVDGELEMEDVAPSSDCQFDQRLSLPLAPPLPVELPPPPPPIPSSPPPMDPPPLPSLPLPLSRTYPFTDPVDSHRATYRMQNYFPQSIAQRPSTENINSASLGTVPYRTQGYIDLQMQMPIPSSSYSSSSYESLPGPHPSGPSANNIQKFGGTPLPNKVYHIRPPLPTLSNQFSYVQADSQQRKQSWKDCSSSPRLQFVHEMRCGNFVGPQGKMSLPQHDIDERCRFSSNHSGRGHSDRPETSYNHSSFYGPPDEPSPVSNRGWPLPPRASNSWNFVPALQSPLENATGLTRGGLFKLKAYAFLLVLQLQTSGDQDEQSSQSYCGSIKFHAKTRSLDPNNKIQREKSVSDDKIMGASQSSVGTPLEESIHHFNVKDSIGNDVDLGIYKGKVLLIVNVASKCGFTDINYTQLTELYNKYKDKDFEILAFPCNQFLRQEPGSSHEAKEFACTRFKAEYPIFKKVRVNGADAAPVYKFLKASTPGFMGNGIKWNFTKFLLNREGKVLARYGPTTPPLSIEDSIKKALEEE